MAEKTIRWHLTEVIEGRWPEIDLHFHSWKYGFCFEIFICQVNYSARLWQAPGPWFFETNF